jgi:type I restriction enzyme M protein
VRIRLQKGSSFSARTLKRIKIPEIWTSSQQQVFPNTINTKTNKNYSSNEQQLWKIANFDTLRGKMDADDFRDYILGFIFYKYLSEKMESLCQYILKPDKITYDEVEKHKDKKELLAAVKEEALDKLGYFLKPSELFSELARRGNAEGKSKFILDDLSKVLTAIEQSTMGSESEEDFGTCLKI